MLTTENTGDEASYANTDTEKAPFSPAWTDIVLLVYCAGILFFILKSIYSFIRIGILLRHGKCEKLYGKVKLVTHSCNIAPFSWMNYIVIPEADMKENGEVILMHEFAHIRHHHSFDLFVAELFAFFQWFNPAAWLMKRELQNVHEYQADNTVINMGVDAKEYQLLLIRKAVGTQRFYSMTHSFNHCKLKSRINMMLKQKSKSWMRLKYLIVLPLAVLSVIAFAHPEVVERMDELSVVRVGDLLSIQDSTSKKRNKMGEEERKRLELRLNLYGKERAHKWKLVEETQAYKDYIEIKNKVESIEEYKGLLDQWRKKFPNTPHSYYHFGGPPSPHIFRPTDFDKHLLVHGTTKLINDFLKLKECEKRLENTTEMKGYRTTKAVSYIARDKDNIFVDNDKTIN